MHREYESLQKIKVQAENLRKDPAKNYSTNVAIFSTLDRNFEILEFFRF